MISYFEPSFSLPFFEPKNNDDNAEENSFNESYINFADTIQYSNSNFGINGNESDINFDNDNDLNQNFEEINNVFNGNIEKDNSTQNFSSQKQTRPTQKDEKDSIKKKKPGRENKNENIKDIHNKFNEDNIMRKIKVHILNQKIRNIFDNYFLALNLKKKKLLKFEQKEIISLKKEENIKLMDTHLKDIYQKYNIGKKYTKRENNYNINLINEIYSENEYIDLQKMFDLTFFEFLEIYTNPIAEKELNEELKQKKKEIESFKRINFDGIKNWIEELENKYKNKNESDDEIKIYISKIKNCCGNYRKLLENKDGRNNKKN